MPSLMPRFEIGQTVYFAMPNHAEVKEICRGCAGSKTLQVTDAHGDSWNVPCNFCYLGYCVCGTESRYEYREWATYLTIGSIRVDTADSNDPIKYMAKETGIGSGTIYKERELFFTHDEAILESRKLAQEYQKLADLNYAETLVRKRKERTQGWEAKKIHQLEDEIKCLKKSIAWKEAANVAA